jgi:hypothetical protein
MIAMLVCIRSALYALTLMGPKGEVTLFGLGPQVRRRAMPGCDASG